MLPTLLSKKIHRLSFLSAGLILVVSFLSFYFFSPLKADAASAFLFLTPSAGAYNVGKNFPVTVQVNTGGVAINAAEGLVSFDPEKLGIVSISRTGSVFSLWTDEPAATAPGIIKFGGGVPTPGYTGTSGTVFTITFNVKAAGDTTVNFVSGAVLANDGKGTNILSTLRGGNYSLSPQSFTPRVQAPVSVARWTPAAPRISSLTHPDPDLWYSKNTASFQWAVPTGVTALRLLIGKISTAIPTVLYEPPIKKKIIEDLEDGIWYFHARFRNSNGWGQVAHFPLKIDTVAPRPFQIMVLEDSDPTNPSPLLKFKATDATSGIARYDIKIDATEVISITPDELSSKAYKLPPQAPGEHSIFIKAYDRAGNFTTSSVDVTIEPIEVPIITDFPTRLSQGNQLIIKGISTPNAKIIVSVRKEGEVIEEGSTKADKDGIWRYVHAKSLERGAHTVWAVSEDSRGAQSKSSELVTIAVRPPLFLKFGSVAIDYLSTMITLVILIVVFVGAIFYGWYAIIEWRRRLRREVHEAEESVTSAFRALSDDIQEQFEILEKVKSKRDLTREEKRISTRMKENLKVAESFIQKEIKDVEREVD